MDKTVESKMNFNFSEEEEIELAPLKKKDFLNFEISKIIERLEEMKINSTVQDMLKIDKIVPILFSEDVKDILPRFITFNDKRYICKRIINSKKILIASDPDYNVVAKAHEEFCIKHNLKIDGERKSSNSLSTKL